MVVRRWGQEKGKMWVKGYTVSIIRRISPDGLGYSVITTDNNTILFIFSP